MAKFARWNNPTEMARDLKRGLYQLTFKDNMPNEPVTYEWQPDIRSTEGTSFTINASLGGNPTYSIIGNRCFFKFSQLHVKISGNPQSVFWLKLPVPAKSLTEGRWLGYMFCPYPKAIFFNALVYPNEWWLRLEAHSEVASVGTFPATDNAIVIVCGDYEIHPAYIRTGVLQERDVPFESYSTSVWTTFTPVITPGAGSVGWNTVDVNYYVINDSVTMFISGIFNVTALTNTVTLTLDSGVPIGYARPVMEAGPIANPEILVGPMTAGVIDITLPVGNFAPHGTQPLNGIYASFVYRTT